MAYIANVVVVPSCFLAGRLFLFVEFKGSSVGYVVAFFGFIVIAGFILRLAVSVIPLAKRLTAN